MKSSISRAGRCVTLAVGFLCSATGAFAWSGTLAPPATFLQGIGSDTFTFVNDGTSNTIQIGHNDNNLKQVSLCLRNVQGSVPLPLLLADGSVKLAFDSSMSLTFRIGRSLPLQPISNIRDGTSNTIFLGEDRANERCFAGDTEIVDIGDTIADGSVGFIGDDSRFDACFRGARRGFIDGTSNTIAFGAVSSTPICFENVGLRPSLTTTDVPETAPLALLSLGLTALGFARQRASKPRGGAS